MRWDAHPDGIRNSNVAVLALPAELTDLIFELVLHEERSALFYHRNKKRNHPWTELSLALVCRQWRAVAVETTSLWCTYTFVGQARDLATSLGRLEGYLGRSYPRPLDLLLDFVTILEPLRHLSAPRLEHFQVETNDHLSDFARPPTKPGVYINSLSPTIFQAGAPKLSSFWLQPSLYHCCCPPTANITTLHFTFHEHDLFGSGLGFEAFQHVLRLPTLENLSIKGDLLSVAGACDFYSHPETYHMPRLQNLRLQNSPLLLDALPCLRAPALGSLILEDFTLFDVPDNHIPNYHFPSLRSLALIDHKTVAIQHWSERPLFFYHLTQKITHLTVSQRDAFGDWIVQEVMNTDRNIGPDLLVATFNAEGSWHPEDYVELGNRRICGCSGIALHIPERLLQRWKDGITPEFPYSKIEAAFREIQPISDDESDLILSRNFPPGNTVALIRNGLGLDKGFHSMNWFTMQDNRIAPGPYFHHVSFCFSLTI
ncbi:unnamed protein product [Cyclocybe aegerita]|uniref:F-box domain-containing protein n=1 Tax=Cyclocybe aegerita TaxID=1973307 RepID=A0A8S0VQS1_CYCAE|nr:unnamed protein product [Cyclocybe aegerita]